MLDKHLFHSFLHNYREKIFTKIPEKGYATNSLLLENFSHFFLKSIQILKCVSLSEN
jgi:hypothetical protein